MIFQAVLLISISMDDLSNLKLFNLFLLDIFHHLDPSWAGKSDQACLDPSCLLEIMGLSFLGGQPKLGNSTESSSIHLRLQVYAPL